MPTDNHNRTSGEWPAPEGLVSTKPIQSNVAQGFMEEPSRREGSHEISRTAILVLGMHRSGTSATTRVINLLGADISEKLWGPAADNETGFWESQEFQLLNDEILASAGSSWDDWRRFDSDWLCSTAKRSFKERALGILRRDYVDSDLFVLKDPRCCRLLRFWLDALHEFRANTKCVLPIRNPLEVAASLKKRDGFMPAKSNMLWLRYVIDVEYESRGLKRVFIAYDEILDDWRGTADQLSRELDTVWPRLSETAEEEIDRFLCHRHRHHAIDDEHVFADPKLDKWVKETYSALKLLQKGRESSEALARLDIVRAEFNHASDALGAVLRSEEMVREKLAITSSTRIGELEKTIAEQGVRNTNLEQEISSYQVQAGELRQVIGTQKARIGELETIVAAQQAHVDELLRGGEELEARLADFSSRVRIYKD